MPDTIPQSVPVAAQQQPSEIDQLIKNISAPLPYTAAPRQIQMPTSLMRPVQPYTPQQIDQRQMVGRKASREQGIANTIRTAGNVIGEAETKFKQQQQDKVRDAAQKVISAQQAIDEATRAHDAALASGDAAGASKAQQLIQQNTQARDAVFSDPKMRKQLVKGFDISYVDPSSNKTPEHAAVMQAMKNAKTMTEKKAAYQQQQALQQQATQGAASAFAKATAQGAGINPVAMEQRKQEIDLYKDLMTYKAAMAGHGATVTAAQLRVQAQAMQQQNVFLHQQDMLDQRFTQAQHILGQHFSQEFALISAREKAARELADDVYTDKETDPLTMYTKSNAAALKYQDNLTKNQNLLTTLIQERQEAYPEGAGKGKAAKDPGGYQALNAQIALTQQQIKQNQGMIGNLQKQAEQIKTAASIGAGGFSDGGSDSNSTDNSSIGGTDFTDPSNYLNSSSEEDSSQ